MQRSMVIGVVTVVVAASVATVAAVMLATDDDPSPTPTPTATPLRTPVPTPTPVLTPTPDTTPAPTPDTTPAPTPTQPPAATPAPEIRAVASVNCDTEPSFCSRTDQATRSGGQLGGIQAGTPPSYSGVPRIGMISTIEGSTLSVRVEVVNDTSDTFVFARRQIILELFRNGTVVRSLTTDGPGFEMPPGGGMFGNFEAPIPTDDGTYRWQAKVWYFRR